MRDVAASALVRGLVGLHASFTVSDDTIREAGELARELGTVLHVHVAEDRADLDDARRRGYAGPLERLMALDALLPGLDPRAWRASDAEQVRRASAAGCWFVHNPRSNEGNRVGYASALSAARVSRSGTDGWDAGHGGGGSGAETSRRRTRRPGRRRPVGRGLRAGGGTFWRRDEPLAPGSLGDCVVRRSGAVVHVIVGGRIVVENGALATGDFGQITANAREEAARLWSRMAEI